MAKFSLVGIIAIAVYLSSKRCYMFTCKYVIKDLPETIEVDNNFNHGDTIFTFTLLDKNSNQEVTDSFLVPDDSQPVMNKYVRTIGEPGTLTGFYYVSGIGIGNMCPPPGTTETFFLTIQKSTNCKYTVRVEVTAAIIDFHVQPLAEIYVNQMNFPVMVAQFQVADKRQCVKIECSVKALNSNTTFTVTSGTFTVTAMPDDIIFDVYYDLQVICLQRGSALSDRNKATVIALFKNNLTQTSFVSTVLSTDFTYFETKMHPLPTLSVDASRDLKSSSRTVSTSIHFEIHSVTKSPKLRGLSTDTTASNSGSKVLSDSNTQSTPYSGTLWMSDTDKSITSLHNILQRNGNHTTTHSLSRVKPETRKLTFGSTTTLTAVSSIPPIGQLSAEKYSSVSTPYSVYMSNDANGFLDSPVKVATVSSAAGVAGLGAAGVLIYHASRRCRIPSVVSPAVVNDDREDQDNQDVSRQQTIDSKMNEQHS